LTEDKRSAALTLDMKAAANPALAENVKGSFWSIFFSKTTAFQIRHYSSLLTKASDFTFLPSENLMEKLTKEIFSMRSRLRRNQSLLLRLKFYTLLMPN
jgi:hypothetical protein